MAISNARSPLQAMADVAVGPTPLPADGTES